jgi:N-acetylmuramic acid 6-phosphate etherase
MLDHLQTEARNPASTNLDELTALELVQLMNREDSGIITAVASQAAVIARAVERIADGLRRGGRLIYVGAGTSGRLGVLDATECPPTFSSPPGQVVGLIAGGPTALTQAVEGAEDRPELAERDLQALQLEARDVVVGIATSGRTPYVLGALSYARKLGVFTIGLSCNPDSDLAPLADVNITPVVGAEVLSGSTRLKAGTATKMVLNMLSTGAMVLLGKTYGNLMVDLRATNSKLRARSNRIIRMITRLSEGEADLLLQSCAGELKTALVVHHAKVTAEEARARLAAMGGRVGKALGQALPRQPERPATPEENDLCLGIDGGGTRTIALLARCDGSRWTLLGRGPSGPANLHTVGSAAAFAALDAAVNAAFAAAGKVRTRVASACLGLAGAGRAAEQQQILDWARQADLAENIEVTTDAEILLAAGTPAGWGLALVAGTGSIAYGRSAQGSTARAGGWGYLLGDEGSGYALVVAALQAIARAADERGQPTALTERLLARLGLRQPQELASAIYRGTWDRTKLAGLAPLVLETAEAGDAVAESVVAEAARELARAGAAVAAKLGMRDQSIPLALAGGVLLGSAGYRKRVLEALASSGVRPGPVTLVHEPAEGAVRRAMKTTEPKKGDGTLGPSIGITS